MRCWKRLAVASAGVCLCALLSGCPRPATTKLSIVLKSTLAEASSPPKGAGTCAEIPGEHIAALNITIDEIRIHFETNNGGTGAITVVEGPVVVSILDETKIIELIGAAIIPPGTYVGATLVISDVEVALPVAPAVFLDADVPDQGVLTTPFLLMTDGGGDCHMVFELRHTICQFAADGGLQADTAIAFMFAAMLESVEAEGRIAEVLDQERFKLENLRYELTVDYSMVSAIFLPADGMMPTGTVADLGEDALVRVTGTLETNGQFRAEVIEILPVG